MKNQFPPGDKAQKIQGVADYVFITGKWRRLAGRRHGNPGHCQGSGHTGCGFLRKGILDKSGGVCPYTGCEGFHQAERSLAVAIHHTQMISQKPVAVRYKTRQQIAIARSRHP